MAKPVDKPRRVRLRKPQAALDRLAKLAETAHDSEYGSTTALLAQVAEITKIAHALWFGLLALLAYCVVTLLTVEDKDFFAYSAKTTLPILNIQIDTTSFFFFAPALICASYVHLHLYLLRLWKLLAELPPSIEEGRPIADRVSPWLITSMTRTYHSVILNANWN